jgi:hypothetical protein
MNNIVLHRGSIILVIEHEPANLCLTLQFDFGLACLGEASVV